MVVIEEAFIKEFQTNREYIVGKCNCQPRFESNCRPLLHFSQLLTLNWSLRLCIIKVYSLYREFFTKHAAVLAILIEMAPFSLSSATKLVLCSLYLVFNDIPQLTNLSREETVFGIAQLPFSVRDRLVLSLSFWFSLQSSSCNRRAMHGQEGQETWGEGEKLVNFGHRK